MMDRLVVERKAQHLAQYLNELKPLKGFAFNQFREDAIKRYAVERLMQLIVDEAIDINAQLILASRNAPPKDYYSSFIQLASIGALQRSFAEKLAPTTALRNALVHEYEEIDASEVHRNIKRFLTLYPRYLRDILSFISRRSCLHG